MHVVAAKTAPASDSDAIPLLAAPAHARKHETGFLDRTITVQGITYKYQVYVPDNWNSHQKWPVILFLHGAGERGDDGLLETDVGIGPAIRNAAAEFPRSW